jgi:hypothetical protein
MADPEKVRLEHGCGCGVDVFGCLVHKIITAGQAQLEVASCAPAVAHGPATAPKTPESSSRSCASAEAYRRPSTRCARSAAVGRVCVLSADSDSVAPDMDPHTELPHTESGKGHIAKDKAPTPQHTKITYLARDRGAKQATRKKSLLLAGCPYSSSASGRLLCLPIIEEA